ncbi:MAG TPA: serine/threonine-protein kinase [Blastocatellia bacterium]|nr:serine/threonine-protein kinase [Blastocatellia bacterium]
MIGYVVGNYRITEPLGEGGMGAVYKGVDMMLEREVAIKVLRPEFGNNPQLVERFRSEAVTLAKLNHPNIATLHTFFRQGDQFFMVMEFVRGETLDHALKRMGAMPVEHAVSLFCQALEGIGHAHQLGIVHRDIKPANMMITPAGSIKVMDFGIARMLGSSRLTMHGGIVGTLAYMSPEQVQGYETDARSDIYSLGILLYEMVTGRVPFESPSEFEIMRAQIEVAPPPPRTFAGHIPVGVEHAIMRALAKRPEARFQSVKEFRLALEEGLRAAAPAWGAAQPHGAGAGEQGSRGAGVMPPAPPYTTPASGPGTQPAQRNSQPSPAYGYQQPPPPYNYPAPQPYTPPQPQGSYFSKLTWAHFAGAGVFLLFLLAAPFVIVAFLSKPATSTKSPAEVNVTPMPAPVQPSQPQPQPPPPVRMVEPIRPSVTIPTPSAPQVSEERDNSSKESGSRTSRQRRSRDSSQDAAARERQRRRDAALKALDQ